MERKDFFKSAGAALITPSLFGFNTVTETSKLDITQNEIYEYAAGDGIDEYLFNRLMHETAQALGNKNSVIVDYENKTLLFKHDITLLNLLAYYDHNNLSYLNNFSGYSDTIVFKSFLMVNPKKYKILNEDLLCKNLKMKKITGEEFINCCSPAITRCYYVYKEASYYKFDKPHSILI